eukprot:SAG22_NODE_4226_length_1336_cov_1.983023_1_plen_178_part_10
MLVFTAGGRFPPRDPIRGRGKMASSRKASSPGSDGTELGREDVERGRGRLPPCDEFDRVGRAVPVVGVAGPLLLSCPRARSFRHWSRDIGRRAAPPGGGGLSPAEVVPSSPAVSSLCSGVGGNVLEFDVDRCGRFVPFQSLQSAIRALLLLLVPRMLLLPLLPLLPVRPPGRIGCRAP